MVGQADCQANLSHEVKERRIRSEIQPRRGVKKRREKLNKKKK